MIVEHLLRDGFFPARPWREGQPCADGTMLEVLLDGRIRAQHQAARPYGPWFPPSLIDSVEFPDARTAALHLIEADFPKGIDGVPIIFP